MLACAIHVRGVILYATGDPAANTSEPGGILANSGWQYQCLWGGYLGTAIAPRFFISAQHIGGNVGDKCIFKGQEYTTSQFFDDPDGDLRLWRVCETFPVFAPLYANEDEVGKSLVVFGRGTQRGEAVSVGNDVKGWRWGPSDNVRRWGENRISAIADITEAQPGLSGAGLHFRCRWRPKRSSIVRR